MIFRGRTILVTVGGLLFIMSINGLLQGGLTGWITDTSASVLVTLRKPLVGIRGLIDIFHQRAQLAGENRQLRSDLAKANALAAHTDQEKRELAFYRTASGIRARLPYTTIIEGAIFSVGDVGGVRRATLNRGTGDDVADGDIIIDPEGTFLGRVRDTGLRHASVQLLGDPSLEVAGRILGTDITGLVRWSTRGLLLDLIRKDETIREGQIIVTSGDDQVPPSLIVGRVQSVDMQSPTLFALVRVMPAQEITTTIRVLILHQ